MRFRRKAIPDLDGLTRHDVERIRGAAAVSVVPGMEGLARVMVEQTPGGEVTTTTDSTGTKVIRSTDVLPGKRVAKRAKPPA